MAGSLDAIVSQGLAAVEADELDRAREAVDEALKHTGENDPAVLHLKGMLAWAEGELDRAEGFLLQATDASPNNPRTYLDCVEVLLDSGEDLDQAEGLVRTVLGRDGLDAAHRDEGRLLLAQIRLQHADADAEESLELLDAIETPLKEQAVYASVRAAVLVELGRFDVAQDVLQKAVKAHEDEPELLYQLGQTRREAGDEAGALTALEAVVALDEKTDDYDPIDYEEVQGLRTLMEDVMEELPDPLLRRVAPAGIVVQARPTVDQVRSGVDPRGFVGFVGNDPGQDTAELSNIVIMRNVLLDDLIDEDEVPDALMVGILEEMRRFFAMSELVMATA